MYYTGTKKQCSAYNDKVTKAEKYKGETQRWATPRKHPEKNIWAISKHPKYDSDMEILKQLPKDWTDETI